MSEQTIFDHVATALGLPNFSVSKGKRVVIFAKYEVLVMLSAILASACGVTRSGKSENSVDGHHELASPRGQTPNVSPGKADDPGNTKNGVIVTRAGRSDCFDGSICKNQVDERLRRISLNYQDIVRTCNVDFALVPIRYDVGSDGEIGISAESEAKIAGVKLNCVLRLARKYNIGVRKI